MSARTWNKDRAEKRIASKIAQLPLNEIEIKDYVRDTDLTSLAGHVAYRVDGAHLYADILNLTDMLHVTSVEGETCHRRTLRFYSICITAQFIAFFSASTLCSWISIISACIL